MHLRFYHSTVHCKLYLPNGQQTIITLHHANIKWTTGLTEPQLSSLSLAVFRPNTCYNYRFSSQFGLFLDDRVQPNYFSSNLAICSYFWSIRQQQLESPYGMAFTLLPLFFLISSKGGTLFNSLLGVEHSISNNRVCMRWDKWKSRHLLVPDVHKAGPPEF